MSAELPKGWKRVALGECCQIISGATPSRDAPEYWGGEIPWVTPKDISKLGQPVLEDAPEKITQAGYAACSTTLMPAGSILFSSRAPIGLVAIAGREMCTNQGFKSFVPGKDVDSGFLYWTMKRNAPRVAALGNGATFKEVSKEIVAKFEINIPPLDEQRRIAAILDKADAIRRKRQQALALADDFLRSAFLEMFGDLRRNSKGWPTASISDICEQIVDCVNRTAPAVEGPTPFKMLRTTNIRNGVIHLDPVKYVDQETFGRWNRRLPPRQGDVILTREAPVGEVGLVNFDDFVFLGQRLMLYRADPSIVTPAYLLHMFLDLYLKAQFDRGGMGSTVKHLPLPVCRSFEVRVPPLNLQQRFSALKQCQSKILLSLTKQFGDANTLFASLSQRAFRGEL